MSKLFQLFLFTSVLFVSCMSTPGNKEQQSKQHVNSPKALVSLRPANLLVQIRIDEKTSKLIRDGEFSIYHGPSSIYHEQGSNTFFIGLRDSISSIGAVRIDENDSISLLSINPIPLNPVHLALDPDGKHLWVSSYTDSKWAIFKLNKDRTVINPPIDTFNQIIRAHQIEVQPHLDQVLVPALGMDAVLVYSRKGILEGSNRQIIEKISFPPGSGPRHMVFQTRDTSFYVALELSSEVVKVEFDQKNNKYNVGEPISTLPDDYNDRNSVAQIKLSPDQKYLYVSNRGHHSIAVFRLIDQSPGLELVSIVPTEARPRAFNIDPSGRWLLVAGQEEGFLALFERNFQSGELNLKDRLLIGKEAMWVEFY